MSSIFDSLSDTEIKDFVTDKLISTTLCRDFSFDSYDNITNSIVLTHDLCGNAFVTSLKTIEKGTINCPHCQMERIRRIQDFQSDIKDMNLQIVKKDGALFLVCKKCGEAEKITQDMLDEPFKDCFSCPHIDCTVDNLLGKYFDHEVLDSGMYFVDAFHENVFDRFEGNKGYTKLICRECNKNFIISNEKIPTWDFCPYCLYYSCLEEAEVSLNSYDMSNDTVNLVCKKCNSLFYFTIEQFEEEDFDCPVCSNAERAWIDIGTPIEKLPFTQNTLKQLSLCGIKTFGDISPSALKYLLQRSESVRDEVLNILKRYL